MAIAIHDARTTPSVLEVTSPPPTESPLSQAINRVSHGLCDDMKKLGWKGGAIQEHGVLVLYFDDPEILTDLKGLFNGLAESHELFRKDISPQVAENVVRILMLSFIFNEAKRLQLNETSFSATLPQQLASSEAWKLALALTNPSGDNRVPFKHFMHEIRDLRNMAAFKRKGDPRYNQGGEQKMRENLLKSFERGENKADLYESPAIKLGNQRVSFRQVIARMILAV